MASCRAVVKSQLSFHAEIFRELLSDINNDTTAIWAY